MLPWGAGSRRIDLQGTGKNGIILRMASEWESGLFQDTVMVRDFDSILATMENLADF